MNPPKPCQEGFFCPQGTPSAFNNPCPPGTFSDKTKNMKAKDCEICTPGFYCSGGKDAPDEQCPAGYYCLEGTLSKEQYPCPETTYNPEKQKDNITDCIPCIEGLDL